MGLPYAEWSVKQTTLSKSRASSRNGDIPRFLAKGDAPEMRARKVSARVLVSVCQPIVVGKVSDPSGRTT